MQDNQYHAVTNILQKEYRVTLEESVRENCKWMVECPKEFVRWIGHGQ
ncbi:MAG: hypothetical protein PHC41_12740 [Lachnospiraceae bacterium]|nr:hypothetical protein [Lachnospiraceae bacterium]MDD3617074.1 hypothetical protein [Lachnospiraceae bacterium]